MARSCRLWDYRARTCSLAVTTIMVSMQFATLEGMEKAVQVIVRIAELTAQRK